VNSIVSSRIADPAVGVVCVCQ